MIAKWDRYSESIKRYQKEGSAKLKLIIGFTISSVVNLKLCKLQRGHQLEIDQEELPRIVEIGSQSTRLEMNHFELIHCNRHCWKLGNAFTNKRQPNG